MAFNRSSINLGNQFAHAAAVSRGEESENSNRSRPYFTIPQGMKFHKWTASEERFNVLLAKNNESDPDDTGYKFYKGVPVHELANLADPKHPHQYPCLKIIGRPCPCCERKDTLDDGTKGGENWQRIKPFMPKDRVLYYLNPEGTNDILVHECAARQPGDAAFPQRLMAQATAMSEGTLPIPFASADENGRIVKVNTSKGNFNGNEYWQANAINFFPRRELPADELYERCTPWNEILNFGTYEEMERVMNGGEPDPYKSGSTAKAQEPAKTAHTEDERQAEFERACEQSLNKGANAPTNGFKSEASAFSQAPANNGFSPSGNANNGFRSTPVGHPVQDFRSQSQEGPLSEEDLSRDPYTAPARSFPSEQVQASEGTCPNGLRMGVDFETSRKCCNCNAYDQCAKARRNG